MVIGWYESNVTNKDIYPISITDSLEKYKADIKKAGTYNVLVITDRFKLLAANNTTKRSSDQKYVNAIDIPETLTDVTLNIDFSDKIKAANNGGVMTVNDNNLDFVNLSFADGETLTGLNLNLDATTMTLNGAATIIDLDVYANLYGVYQYYNNTFGDRGVTLDKGITVNAVYPKRGFVIVDDATVEALVVYNGSDEDGQNKVWGRIAGVENNELVEPNNKGYYNDIATEQYTFEAVKNTNGSTHYLNSVKVRAGENEGDYTSIWAYTPTTPIETVTICANANVYLKNVADHGNELHNEFQDTDEHVKGHSYVNHIVGAGTTSVVSVGNPWYAFQDVEDVTSVTINNDFNKAPDTVDPDSDPLRVYAELNKCAVDAFKNVYFFSTTQKVNETKFSVAENVLFYVDAKNGATAYGFDYYKCELPKAEKIGVTTFDVEAPVLDENGEQVRYVVWHYVVYDEDGTPKTSGEKDDNGLDIYEWTTTSVRYTGASSIDPSVVPLQARLDGNVWFHIVDAIESDVRINDMTITIGLEGTKINQKALTGSSAADLVTLNKDTTAKNKFINTVNNIRDLWPEYEYRAEMTYKYHFGDSQLYRWTRDNTLGQWIFVTTK